MSNELDETGLADLKLTVTLTYKANPKDYTDQEPPTSVPMSLVDRMAAIDKENYEEDLECLLDIIADYQGSVDIKVEPLPEGEI